MSWNDWVFSPSLVLELLGTIIVVVGIVTNNPLLLIYGAALFCIALGVNIGRILWRLYVGSAAPGPALQAPAGTVAGMAGDSPFLYVDRLVRIDEDSITFLHYSFPFSSSGRQVFFRDIDHIVIKKPGLLTGKWRIAGSGDLRTWFPLDWDRPSRDRIFRAMIKTRGMNIGFTVEHPAEVTAILRKKGLILSDEVSG